MRARILTALGAATLFLTSCTSSNAPTPHPTSVSPPAGFIGKPIQITISGDGFVAAVTQPAGGGSPTTDATQKVWLGGVELQSTWVSDQKIVATVPAGLSAGPQNLVVENAYGLQGTLPNAFCVAGGTPTCLNYAAILSAAVTASAATVSVSEPFTMSATIENTGATAATLTSVSPLLTPASSACAGNPTPTVASVGGIPAGGSQTFVWTCKASHRGALGLAVDVNAVDDFSGNPISVISTPATTITVQNPPSLSAQMTAPVGVINKSNFLVTMEVTNSGDAAAKNVTPLSFQAVAGYTAGFSIVASPQPITIPAGTSGTLSWTIAATSTGTVQFTGTVTATDPNTGATVPPASATSGPVVVETPTLVATLALAPSTASVGQTMTLVLTLKNTGAGTIINIAPPIPTAQTGTATLLSAPTQPIASLAPNGGTGTFTWTYQATSAGSLAFSAIATGTDQASGLPVIASAASNAALIQTAATLGATLTAVNPTTLVQLNTVSTGQVFNAILSVTNAGQATALSVTPTTISGVCTGTPVPQNVGPGAIVQFTYTNCSTTTTPAITLNAAASGKDQNTGLTVSTNTATTTLAVQQAAALTATLTSSTLTASIGQVLNMTLTLTNSGQAAATVSSIAPVAPSGATCTAVAPAPPQIVNAGSSVFTWTCTPTVAGSLTFGATVVALDANSGANISPKVTGVTVTVQAGSVLAPTFTISRTTADVAQNVTVTLTLANAASSAPAKVSAITPSYPAGVTCSTVTGTLPQTINGGSSATFTWTCVGTVASATPYQLNATVTATDANSGANVAPVLSSLSLTVQTAGPLTAGLTLSPSGSANVNQAITVSLVLTNPAGFATANVTGVTPTMSPTTGMTCTAASPAATAAAPVAIAGGGNATFTWTCTGTTAATYTLSATVTAVDANTGSSAAPSSVPAPTIAVQATGLLTASWTSGPPTSPASVGEGVKVSMTLSNPSGNGAASVTALTPTVSPTTGMICTAASPVPPQTIAGGSNLTFTWTCTGSVTGTYTLSATVAAVDVNTGKISMSPSTVPSGSVLVESVPTLTITKTTADTPLSGFYSTGQTATITFTFLNSGGATANVTSGSVTSGCTVNPPTTSIAGGATPTITMTCALTTAANPYNVSATFSYTDANTGIAYTPVVGSYGLPVESAATMPTPGVSVSPAGTLFIGQAFTFTITTNKGGTAGATISAIALTQNPSGMCLGASDPLTPVSNVPSPQDFKWNCAVPTGAVSSGTLSGTVTWYDQNVLTNENISSTPAGLSFANPLSATFSPLSVPASTTFSLTLSVTDSGPDAISVSPGGLTASGFTCGSGPTPASQIVSNGAPVAFTWSCTSGSAGSLSVSSTISGPDQATGVTVSFTASGTGTVTAGSAKPAQASQSNGPVALVASDPFGDGTSAAPLLEYQGAVWLGPNRDGTTYARLDASGTTAAALLGAGLGVETGQTPASNSAWLASLQATTIGGAGCALNTVSCGPDNESGADVAVAGTIGGVEQFFVSGTGTSGSRYLYSTSAGAGTLTFSWTDVRTAVSPGAVVTAALAVPDASSDRLYLGYGVPGSGPQLLALGDVPSSGGLDAIVGKDIVDLVAAAIPGVSGATNISSMANLSGVLYVAHDGGFARALAGVPGPALEAPGDWALATPSVSAWTAKSSIPLAGVGSLTPRDRAIPAMASFGACTSSPCVYAIRNVEGTATQPTVVGQLWRCDPSAGPYACSPGDWTLAVANSAGDTLLTQFGDETNGAVTLLVATPHWLYVGFDNGSSGVQLYRASVAPQSVGDFVGQNGCVAGSYGCQGLGGNGFGDATVTRIFDSKAVTVSGVTALWIAAGDGSGPERVYKVAE